MALEEAVETIIPSVLLSSWRRRVRLSLWVGLVCAMAVTLLLSYRFVEHRRRVEEATFQNARVQAARAAAQINHAFGEATALGNALAHDLGNGTLPYSAIDTRMQAELTSQPNLDGVAVTFEPYVYSPSLRVFQSYISKGDDGSLQVQTGHIRLHAAAER